ncbi:lichenicidin A2 family type 2 lantibiotic [Robinsoniella sp. KNHs210]|uniref:lichenicidin A2 family type 2 lantibiotic n=1 Tax=Robinsoniella sp. KNHs210 TaxID=1469950 RepID=UPI00048220E0|nr:lichenicidin A2 family type 2 lantibiotic [Robinsoniella sp. KNHs210]
MSKKTISELVGKSYEELSVEEMYLLQGANGEDIPQPYATPVIISLTVASAGLSGAVSKAVSTLITVAASCV